MRLYMQRGEVPRQYRPPEYFAVLDAESSPQLCGASFRRSSGVIGLNSPSLLR